MANEYRLSASDEPPCAGRRAWAAMYAAAWACTLGTAVMVTVAGGAAQKISRSVLGLSLHPAAARGGLLDVLALAAHNTPIAAWPLLLTTAGAHRGPRLRLAADTAVVACLLVNTVPVGAALGAYGPPVVAFLPQLPLEWAALAVGYASWLQQRHTPLPRRQRVTRLVVIAGLLAGAAVLETYAVPRP